MGNFADYRGNDPCSSERFGSWGWLEFFRAGGGAGA
jgi:hypothetical protein